MRYLKIFIQISNTIITKPTKFFIFVVISLFVLFFQAYMHNFNIVFIIMFSIFAVSTASSWIGRLNLFYLKFLFVSSDRFFANKISTYRILVENSKDTTSYNIDCANDSDSKTISILNEYQREIISLEYKYPKRGEYKIPKLKISSLFPLPHELFYKYEKLDNMIMVFANPIGKSIFSTKLYNQNIRGEYDDFDGIRRFKDGENLSLIHWASYAKNQQLMSKEFIFKEQEHIFKFDIKSMNGDYESRLSQLTLWVLECEKAKFDFTIDLGYEILDSKKGDIYEILTKIAKY